jgi:hypothetical protein
LCRRATVAPRDSKEDSIVLGELVGGDNGVVSLGWSVHLAQDLFGQRFGHLKDIAFRTGLQDALFDAFAHGGHMTVHGIVNNGNLGHDFKLEVVMNESYIPKKQTDSPKMIFCRSSILDFDFDFDFDFDSVRDRTVAASEEI